MDFVDNNIQKVQVQPEDQVYARNEDIKVYGKLVSMSTENVVADSEQIWDEALKKNQSDINSQTQSKFGEYLPLTGGDINGNLNVYGTVDLTGPLTLGDSLRIEEGVFTFEGDNNESLTINYNGLTYAYTETDSQRFNVKEGDVQANSITITPKDNSSSSAILNHNSLSISDGENASIQITPTSVVLNGEGTNITTKTINADDIMLHEAKGHGSSSIYTSITPGLINVKQTGARQFTTTIQPSGISSAMFQLAGGTDQDVLLGDGTTIKLGQPDGVAKLDQNGNIPLKNLGNIDTQIALVVDKLPTTDIKTNKIYLVRKNETGEDNAYVEYVYINNSWEKLGEYTPSIDLSGYSLKQQTVSSVAFVHKNSRMLLQLTNADNSKSNMHVPLAQSPGVSDIGLTNGQDGIMSMSDKVKLDGIDNFANNYTLKNATASDLGGIKIGFNADNTSKNYPVSLQDDGKAYVHVPWVDTQVDTSNCVKTDQSSTIDADVTVNGKISSQDADIVIENGKLELHEGSNGINFIGGNESSYISASGGKSNEYFATDGTIQTIPNSYLPLSGGTVTGGITVDGAINTKSNITTDGTVTAKGFVSKTEKNRHEVWACNGGSINLKTLIAATAVYVHGSIVESIAESINSTVTIDDPDAIIFNKATGSFVAKKGNGYYRYWNTINNLLISDSDKYGFLTSKRGIVPYHKQLYIFDNDNVNIYIANNTGSVSILDIYIN